jgi:hypothetical protein
MLFNGHAPGHVRETFRDAIHAFMGWNDGEPEPMVEFEERQIPISKACGVLELRRDHPGLPFPRSPGCGGWAPSARPTRPAPGRWSAL